MVNQCMNSVAVKSDVLYNAIIRYNLVAERFLTIDERDDLSQLTETDFLELVNEKGWRAYRID